MISPRPTPPAHRAPVLEDDGRQPQTVSDVAVAVLEEIAAKQLQKAQAAHG